MLRSILDFFRRHWRWVVAFQLAALAGWFISQGVTAEGQAKVRADKFRKALAGQNPTAAWELVSARYQDQWGMGRDDLRLAMQDCTSQFLALDVEWVDPRIEKRDGGVLVTVRPRLTGRSLTPVGEIILERAARMREPLSLRWEKEGWWPWTWRLVSIRCPDLEIPAGYRPGMLRDTSGLLEQAVLGQ